MDSAPAASRQEVEALPSEAAAAPIRRKLTELDFAHPGQVSIGLPTRHPIDVGGRRWRWSLRVCNRPQRTPRGRRSSPPSAQGRGRGPQWQITFPAATHRSAAEAPPRKEQADQSIDRPALDPVGRATAPGTFSIVRAVHRPGPRNAARCRDARTRTSYSVRRVLDPGCAGLA